MGSGSWAGDRVNYLKELNRMYDFCMSNMLSKSEILLLHALYMINNKKDWDAWFEADNYQIQRLTGGLSRQSIVEARNKLKQRGRIEFKDGKRNKQSPFYRVIPFFKVLDIQPDIKGGKETDIQPDIQGDHLKNKLNQTKPNQTEKESKPKKKFVKPTVEEIRAYCVERGNSIDPEYFWNFYESKNWMVGKNKMSSWKSCVVTWEKNRRDNATQSQSNQDSDNIFFNMLREEGKI